jgi:divalent metal cation (Fe/Co/Zn/Cd) transporter
MSQLAAPERDRTAVLKRRVRLLVGATITYNAVEAVIALWAGAEASSSALIGFGLDSIVEVMSAAAVAWQFSGGGRHSESRERVALRTIAISFFALAAFVTFDALRTLLGAAEPDHSTVGIALAAVSVVVMPGLSLLQRRTGRELGSSSVVADSKQTLICSYLSAVLLVGLLLNSLLGWSWADPIAALVIAAMAVREGREAWQGDSCCTPVAVLLADPEADADGGCGCSSGCADACCTPAAPGASSPDASASTSQAGTP